MLDGKIRFVRENYLYRIKQSLFRPISLKKFLEEPARVKALNEIPLNSLLIPVPSGTKTFWNDHVYPSLLISQSITLVREDLSVSAILYRKDVLTKSKGTTKANRSTVQDQINSLGFINQILDSENLVLIDDVVTAGNTFIGCYLFLKNIYPNKHITCIALINASREYATGQDWRTVLKGTLRACDYSHSTKTIKEEIRGN